MTPYDATMAALLIGGMVWGAWRGIVWQLASIASVVVGYSVSHPLSGQLAPHFPGPPVVARALAMMASYAVVSGAIFLVAWAIRATLRQMKFEAFDRHLGLVLGGLEAALLGIVGTLFVVSLAPQTREPIFSSPTGHIVGRVMDAVGPVLPSEIRTELAKHWSPDAEPPAALVELPVKTKDRPAAETKDGETVGDLLQNAEARVGKAIADEAKRELQGALDNGNDRDVERR
jgi:membrane protein required for colicin V production